MARSESEQPTELELEILKVLWEKSPLLVRDVRAGLEQADRPLPHSTVITMLNIMHRKGYLKRRKEGKSFWFWPASPKKSMMNRITGDIVSRCSNDWPKQCYSSIRPCGSSATASANCENSAATTLPAESTPLRQLSMFDTHERC